MSNYDKVDSGFLSVAAYSVDRVALYDLRLYPYSSRNVYELRSGLVARLHYNSIGWEVFEYQFSMEICKLVMFVADANLRHGVTSDYA